MPATPTLRLPRPGDRLEVAIERLDERGFGVGSACAAPSGVASEGLEIAARASAPGERVLVEVVRRKRARVEARRIERLADGPFAVPARCPHFGTCGGCAFQTSAYARQLIELRRNAQEELARAGLAVELEPVLGMEDPWHYRNKMDFTFADRRWVEAHEPLGAPADFALGLHVAGRHDKVLDIARCALHFRGADELLAGVRSIAQAHGLAPWSLSTQTGLLRHLVLRNGLRSGEILVNIVTARDAPEQVLALAGELCRRHPEITTLVQNVNTRPAAIAAGEREHVLHGAGVIRELAGGLTFTLSANSFFQTNTLQAERLFAMIAEDAESGGGARVLDLYCGAGAIALYLAQRGAEVVGIELVPEAVRDARRNAQDNGLAQRVEFLAGDVRTALAQGALDTPDVIVLDPPRAGLHPRVLAEVAALGAARVVYVSCNIKAAARDLGALVAQGFALERARALDLFPHTPHLETVFRLSRRARV